MKTPEEQRADSRERQRKYRERHPERAKRSVEKWQKANREYFPKYRAKNPALVLASYARERAKKNKLPFDLYEHTEEIQKRLDIGICEMSGVSMTRGRSHSGPFSPSIDRIEPNLGYVYSNIRVVCHALNMGMSDWGVEPLIQILDGVRARLNQAPISTA